MKEELMRGEKRTKDFRGESREEAKEERRRKRRQRKG